MTLGDIFKKDFLDQVEAFSFTDTVICLGLALAIGCFIFEIYKKTYKGVMYSRNFGVTLVTLAMITTLAIMTVTSNVVLSLGMVGALSIVRFRTAIKEPMDISFLFWSIVVGIMLGAGMIPLAVLGSLVLGIVFVFFNGQKDNETPYILVVQCENDAAEAAATARLDESVKKYNIKSKTVSKHGIELTVEIRLNEPKTQFVNDLSALDGVHNATLVSYNGEYMS